VGKKILWNGSGTPERVGVSAICRYAGLAGRPGIVVLSRADDRAGASLTSSVETGGTTGAPVRAASSG
jgi:hypothetical protein